MANFADNTVSEIAIGSVPPTTSVIIPSNGATLSGTAATLDASASNATSLEFGSSVAPSGYSRSPSRHGHSHLLRTGLQLEHHDGSQRLLHSYCLRPSARVEALSVSNVNITVNNSPTPPRA